MLYRFGPYELDEERLVLRRADGAAGEPIALEPKPLAVLLHLLRRHPLVIPGEELLGVVWADAVVTRSSLARAVRSLRRAFGEDANGPSVIRTVRGGGYGIAVPVERAVGAALPSALAADASARAVSRGAPLLGREKELAALADLLARAAAGRGRVATLVGEPGIGKSRLGEALAERAAESGWSVLVGRAADERGAPALWLWIQVLRAAVAGFPRRSVSAALGRGSADLLALVPELARPLDERGVATRALDEGDQQFRLLDAVDAFLAGLASERPLLVFLDDLHWADASSLALFAHLARNASARALALVASHRPLDAAGSVDSRAGLAALLERLAPLSHVLPPIRLGGLPADALAAVAEAEAGFALSAAQRTALHERTGGNPYFAIELVRAGAIRAQPGEAVTRGPTGVPERIRAVVRARVEALPARAQTLLKVAAVSGSSFTLPLLARALAWTEAELLDAMDELERTSLVRENRERPGSFGFVHALVGETLVEGLSRSERVELHARVAQALEGLHGHDPGPHLAALAHHYGEAAAGGNFPKAAEYARRAGDQAAARLAFAEAALQYRNAIRWESARSDLSQEALSRLWASLGRCEAARGAPAEAEHASFQALHFAEQSGNARLVAEAVWSLAPQYRGPGAARLVAALETALAAKEDDPRSEALLAAMLARHLSFTGDFARVDALSARALELARLSRDPVTELRALSTRDWALLADPRFEERAAVSRARVGLAIELGLRGEEFQARNHRVMRLIQEIDPDGIDREIEECGRLVQALAHPRFEAAQLDVVVLRAIWQGRVAEAEALLPRLRELWAKVDPAYGMMSAGAKFQLVGALAGRVAEVEAREVDGAHGAQRYALPKPYHCSLALRLLDAARDAEAREAFEFLSRNDYEDLNHDSTYLVTIVQLAELAHRLGDARRADLLAAHLEPFAGRYAGGYSAAVRGCVDRYLALIAWTRGDLDAADRLLANAVAAEKRMGSPPWEALVHVDRARLRAERGGRGSAAAVRAELDAAVACCAGLDLPGVDRRVADARARLLPAR